MVFGEFMKWRGPIKAYNIELPEDMHTAIKSAAPKRKTTLRGAYIEAATAWLQSAEGEENPTQFSTEKVLHGVELPLRKGVISPLLEGPDITPGEYEWVIRLLNILRSGPLAARAIKWNLMMILKGMGIPHETQGGLLPRPSEADERAAARKESSESPDTRTIDAEIAALHAKTKAVARDPDGSGKAGVRPGAGKRRATP